MGNNMRNQFLGAAALLATVVAGPAFAADLAVKAPAYKAPPPAPTWTGFYIGANGGYGTGDWKGFVTDQNGASVDIFTGQSVDAKGGFGGGQIGYNWQGIFSPRTVIGIEADFDGGSIGGTSSFINIPKPAEVGTNVFGKTFDFNVDWFGTVRGRLGYDFGGWLLYGTGGVAYGHAKLNDTVTFNGPVDGIASTSETRVGWTAGAGLEYALDPHWSVKGEWLHVDLGNKESVFTGSLVPPLFPNGGVFRQDGFNSSLSFETFKGGVNYRF
jgi:outer membrane immunogenic protein